MSTPILTTKFSIPPKRQDWVLRARLINRLDEGLRRKLILVSAPAGFGKTTLIASWLHGLGDRNQTPPRVAWLSLEEEDNDPIRFLAHLIGSLQTIDPAAGQTIRPFLETPKVPKLNHLMTVIINDLALLSGESVLVLDDYHVINHPGLRTAVAFFLDHLPSRCHLVITTREEPSLPLPRLRARWEVMEIRLQDLRFTGDETSAFLNRTMGLVLTAEATQTLEDRTEGWIAGLQMAALSLRGRKRMPGCDQAALDLEALSGGQRDIIDYLAAEVLRQQPGEVRTFLRQTAILDRFNASLCDAVTGRSDSQTMLAQLEKANLFLIPIDDQRRWYRYHHLFADFLRTELAELEQSALHRKASEWHEAHNMTTEAIKHALAAHDPVAVVRLIRGSAEETLRDGGFTTILGWVNSLPDEIVRAHSDLSVHKGWLLYLRGETCAAETYATQAAQNQRRDDPPVQRGMLLSFRAYLAINRGEPAEAVRLAEEALMLLSGTESFYRTTALSHLGQAQRLVGDRQRAIETLRQAIALGQRQGNHLITLEALGYLTQLLYQQGQLREAIESCEQAARQYQDEAGQPLPTAGLIYVPLGMLYYESNDLALADHYVTTGIALCQRMGTVYPTLLGQRTLARLHFTRGETEAAWQTLAAARCLAAKSENPRRIRLIIAMTAEIQLRQGLPVAAAVTLEGLPGKARERSEQENVTVARLLLARGKAEEALGLLRQLEQMADRQGRLGSLITIHLLQALAHRALGQSSDSLESLEQALSLAAPEGYRSVFLDEGMAVEAILSQMPQRGSLFVGSLLESFASRRAGARRAGSERSPNRTPELIERLSQTQLTVLRLVADGLSNRDIAARLSITEGTTKWHLNQIYGKLNVGSRTQALAQARQLNLL
ncbi:MAG TPA: LuxR C-terminal-related transcriptional regulator [Blastocatellia bacterium]|nr:LuxR C-terminal-related transcriptional regulator [Blastocatellia bacterium]